MINRILVAYDGSDPARKACDFAFSLAQTCQAEAWVLAVARPPDFAEDVETEAIIENSRKYHQRLLAQIKQGLAGTNLQIHFEVAVGHPAEQIIHHAERHNVDLIIMGHRGRSFFERLRLGSVSKQVMDYANCAVLVTR
jgi:nucleotide-binding universal stress UspA family protein